MTGINKYFVPPLAILFLCITFKVMYSIRMPEVPYFPVYPNYSFNLTGDKGSTISMTLRIDIPNENETIDKFFLNWSMIMKSGPDKLAYSLRLILLTNGNIYLDQMKDGVYERSFPPEIIIFPSAPVFNRELEIGENISFKFTRFIGRLSDAALSQVYYNVIEGELKLLDRDCRIYFSKDNGVVMIRTPDETYIQK